MSRSEIPTDLALYQQQMMAWPMDGMPSGGHQEQSSQSLWVLVNDRLRGRWLYMFIAGAVLAVVFGVVGYRSTVPMYVSQGQIRVAPVLPVTMTQIVDTAPLQFYNNVVFTQVQYVRGRRVLERALEDQELRQLEWAKQPNVIDLMQGGLAVEADRKSELIFVTFEATEPTVAHAVCNAVLTAYEDIYASENASGTLTRVREIRATNDRELRVVRADINALLARHQTTDPRQLQFQVLQKLEDLRLRIEAAELALGRAEARAEETGQVGGEDEDQLPTLEELQPLHPRLAEVRQYRDAAKLEFERMKRKYKPGTPQYKKFEDESQLAQRLFEEEYEIALQKWREHGPELLPIDGIRDIFQGLSVARLREEIGNFRTKEAEYEQQSQQLIADIQQLEDLENQAERLRQDMARADERIQGLETEGDAIADRITVVQRAFTPNSPSKDSRKKRAAAGLMFGYALSFGVFFIIGSFDRRTYGTEQLRNAATGSGPRCLGVLPDLGRSASDPESGDVASHCVHQIRNQIEVIRDPRPGYVLTISSPFQGDGKTSIVMALGWSYAAAGYRTLLIDCDLVGRSLTRQVGMIGHEGLKEAMLRGHINGTVVDLSVDHLSILPVGADPQVGPETLRQSSLREILAQAREQFEIIIIDTGPVLGSLESTPASAVADGVVLSLRKGRSRSRLEEAVKRLENTGANLLGIILNCVGRGECYRYVSEASLAVADEERHAHDGDDHPSVIRTANGERNALMVAMENTSRQWEEEEEKEKENTGAGVS